MRPRALCLDLFGTIVFFDGERLPRREVDGRLRIVTIASAEGLLAELQPRVTLGAFLDAVAAASAEIAEEKSANFREVPTGERFRRALGRLHCSGPIEAVARNMVEQHMAALSAAVICPSGRTELLASLAREYPLALVSNFDDGNTARGLLERFALSETFSALAISAEVGSVKPGASIFMAACEGLGVEARDCVHVGDSLEADVEGSLATGMGAVWIGVGDARGASGTIADLAELPRWLRDRYG